MILIFLKHAEFSKFSQQNYVKEKIYILLEALIAFLNPNSENLTNVLSYKNHHNMR